MVVHMADFFLNAILLPRNLVRMNLQIPNILVFFSFFLKKRTLISLSVVDLFSVYNLCSPNYTISNLRTKNEIHSTEFS